MAFMIEAKIGVRYEDIEDATDANRQIQVALETGIKKCSGARVEIIQSLPSD